MNEVLAHLSGAVAGILSALEHIAGQNPSIGVGGVVSQARARLDQANAALAEVTAIVDAVTPPPAAPLAAPAAPKV